MFEIFSRPYTNKTTDISWSEGPHKKQTHQRMQFPHPSYPHQSITQIFQSLTLHNPLKSPNSELLRETDLRVSFHIFTQLPCNHYTSCYKFCCVIVLVYYCAPGIRFWGSYKSNNVLTFCPLTLENLKSQLISSPVNRWKKPKALSFSWGLKA